MRLTPRALLLGLCTAAPFASCGPAAPPQPRLVVLYVPCTVNRQQLSPYDDSIPFTPNFQRFADESLVFDRHVTEGGQSGVAYASIFSGFQANGHGVYAHPKHIPDEMYLITEAFRDNGYETFAWDGHAIGSASLNSQGVDPENRFEIALGAEAPAFVEILDELERDPEYKAFVLTDFTATHAPYRTEWLDRFCKAHPGLCEEAKAGAGEHLEGFIQCYRRNEKGLSYDYEARVERLALTKKQEVTLNSVTRMLYRSNVMKLDARFGRLIDAIDARGLREDSVITVTVDHGEVMDRPNALFRWTHGHALAPEVLNVPLIVRAPGFGVEPGRYEEVTRSMDVFPTLASLCRLEMPGDFACAGTDLTPGILGGERPELLGYSHTALIPYGARPGVFGPRFDELYPREDPQLIWVGIRARDVMYKLRNVGDEVFEAEVFDHAVDPEETTNLFDPADPEHARMLERLRKYKQELVEDYTRRLEAGDVAEEIPESDRLEMLRSLGYIK